MTEPRSLLIAMRQLPAPKLVTVERDCEQFVLLADGVPVLRLDTGRKALWLNARLAEKLAERTA